MGLQVTDLNHKGVRTIALAVNDELSHDSSIIGGSSECTNPPFRGREVWRVHGECLVTRVPSGCGFEATDVGAVPKLSLGVTSNDFKVFGPLEEVLMLLRVTLVSECNLEYKLSVRSCCFLE